MNVKELLKNGARIETLPLKVVFYARVSTEHEEQSTSITNQIDFFKNYINKNPKWTLINSYIDEGISGKNTVKRKEFLKMICDAKRKEFDLILTKSVSRFARNTIDSIYYTELLSQNGIGVYFFNDNINTFYSDSEFRLTLMASIAQDELRKLSESIQFGLSQSIERGVVLGNNNLLGYKKEKGKLIIIEKEAQIVREIYNLYLTKKYNYSYISRIINKKYKVNFDSKRIKRILTNYKYKGYYCGRKSKVIDYKKNTRAYYSEDKWLVYKSNEIVPPIIDEITWNKVNKYIKNKSKKDNIYKNLVKCIEHNIYLKLKRKKYKTKYYTYLICPNCIHISTSMIDRICKKNSYKEIIVCKDRLKEINFLCKKNNY